MTKEAASESVFNNQWVIISVGFLCLLIRAWPRLIYPEVWDEDGIINIPKFIEHGAGSLIEPVNGYLILLPKIITATSLSISMSHYPIISTWITWGVLIGIFYFIATAEVELHGKLLLAVSCMFIPTDPEVFGLPLYSFWWVALPFFLTVFWKPDTNKWFLRAVVMILAPLSTPICILVLPLLLIRGFILRVNKVELALVALGTLCTLCQVYVMSRTLGHSDNAFQWSQFPRIIPRYFGAYAIGSKALWAQWIFGLSVLIYIASYFYYGTKNWVKLGVVYLIVVSIYASMRRVSIDVIHPVSAGPRYFFYPFVLLNWFFLDIALTENNKRLKYCSWVVLLISLLSIPKLYRSHDPLNWQKHWETCVANQSQACHMPVHTNGKLSDKWVLTLTSEQVKYLAQRDLLSRL